TLFVSGRPNRRARVVEILSQLRWQDALDIGIIAFGINRLIYLFTSGCGVRSGYSVNWHWERNGSILIWAALSRASMWCL
ncbi:MAG: hypothetical protein ACREQK_07090, partial [Candidatus Binatia bacterium]